MLSEIEKNFFIIKSKIAKEITPNKQIQIIAVSKKQSLEKIKKLYQLGQRNFGENYLQEAKGKIQHFEKLNINWHFLGKIQSNKCKEIAKYFSWVQSLDRKKTAILLEKEAQKLNKELNICIMVNIANENQKSGILVEDLFEFIKDIAKNYQHLKLRGLMALPKISDKKQTIEQFKKLQELYLELQEKYKLDTLSIGMSQDYLDAIKCGSTMVRIGTKLFGQRE